MIKLSFAGNVVGLFPTSESKDRRDDRFRSDRGGRYGASGSAALGRSCGRAYNNQRIRERGASCAESQTRGSRSLKARQCDRNELL